MGTAVITNWATVIPTGGLYPSPVNSGGGWYAGVVPTTIDDLLVRGAINGVQYYGNAHIHNGWGGSLHFSLDFATPCISLDGNPPVSINELPSGINFNNGRYSSNIGVPPLGGGFSSTIDVSLSPYMSDFSATVTTFLDQDYSTTDLFHGLNIRPIDIVNISLFLSSSGSPLPADFPLVFDYLISTSITMDYFIEENQSFQTQNINTPVHAGDTVSILTPSPADPHHPFDPTTLDSISIQPSDGSSPIPVPSFDIVPDGDGFLIIFDWPDGMPDGVPVGDIIGTTFSGSVLLGHRITIFFMNASGIYQLTPGKTTDTLYNVVDGTTVELAIPDPFAKTGYIGG